MKTTLLKALLVVMILCVAAFAATTTTITDTVYRSDGTAATGYTTISWPTYTADDGRFVIYGSKRVKFTNGVFTVALEPMPNSATYKVEWEQSVSTINGTQTQIKTEYWLVPTSATPLTISQVRVASLVAPTATFNYRLLAGLTKGDFLYSDASGIAARLSAPINGVYSIRWTDGVPSYVAGGGSWGSITGTLSTQTDLQAALSSKQNLINGAPATWPTFAAVATSGAYADLSGKPSIPITAADIGAQPVGSYVTTSDARLTDARTPVGHAATHAAGQSDEIAPWMIGAESANANIQAHIASISNPHNVTAAQVGLAAALLNTCEIVTGDPGAASPVLADDNDTPSVCANQTGVTMTILSVECYVNAGTTIVNPILTGGAATSILSGALTCGTGSFASGTLNGTPTQVDGSTIDGNITTAGGTAKYLIIRIRRTI